MDIDHTKQSNNKPSRKVFFDVNYMNHNIKVINKWGDCSLVIDGNVVDTYKSVIAFNFTLSGTIEVDNKKIEIAFRLENGIPRAKLFLTANGQQIAMGKIFI